MLRRVRHPLLALLTTAILAPASALAAFPEQPIKLIVPYPPGASTDTISRLVADHMSNSLGQPVIVENRGGASGTIGGAMIAKAKPDGYTFGMGTDGSHATAPHLMKVKPYDPLNDFTPITQAVKNILVLVANPAFEPDTIAELVPYAKARPGTLAYGSSGLGSPHFLAGLLLNQTAGLDLLHVPYKGGNPAVMDVIGGQIPLVFSSMASVEPHIRAGKLKALGVTEATRYEGTPDIPAIAETLPGFEMGSWLGFFGPANMDPKALEVLNAALVKAINDPKIAPQLVELGLVPVANSPSQFATALAADIEKRGALLKAAGVEAE